MIDLFNPDAYVVGPVGGTYIGGDKSIVGDVLENGSPAANLVALYARRLPYLDYVASMRSDPATGAYAFTNLRDTHKYVVIGFDPELLFNAEIADNVVPT